MYFTMCGVYVCCKFASCWEFEIILKFLHVMPRCFAVGQHSDHHLQTLWLGSYVFVRWLLVQLNYPPNYSFTPFGCHKLAFSIQPHKTKEWPSTQPHLNCLSYMFVIAMQENSILNYLCVCVCVCVCVSAKLTLNIWLYKTLKNKQQQAAL